VVFKILSWPNFVATRTQCGSIAHPLLGPKGFSLASMFTTEPHGLRSWLGQGMRYVKGARWRMNVTVVGSDGIGEKTINLFGGLHAAETKKKVTGRYEVSFVRFSTLPH
jgi:hypothetical protein